MKYTPEQITSLEPHQVFVFGSNTEGRHGKGAAKTALRFGAMYGNPRGIQGQTYAIVTKSLKHGQRSIPLVEIDAQIIEFLAYAALHIENEFLVTKLGCGLGGYSIAEITKLWKDKVIPNNVVLPKEFLH